MKRLVCLGFGSRATMLLSKMRSLGVLDRDLRLVGAYDPRPDYARQWAAQRSFDVTIYDDLPRLLEQTHPDAIFIASYDSMHLDNFRQIADLPVPVLIEKPLETSVAKAARLVALADARSAPTLAAHNMRFAPILQHAKTLLDAGAIGRINSFRFHNNVHYGDGYFRRWMRQTENIGASLVEKACHDIDILHFLTGQHTRQVIALSRRFEFGGNHPNDLKCGHCDQRWDCRDSLLRKYRDVHGLPITDIPPDKQLCVYAREIDITDDEVCLLELANGAQGTYVQTFYTPASYHGRIYTLVGSNGILEIDLDEFEGDLRIFPRYGSKKEVTREHFDYHGQNHYAADIHLAEHFWQVIQNAAEPACTVRDAYHAIATAISAVQSAQQRQWIKVPTLAAHSSSATAK